MAYGEIEVEIKIPVDENTFSAIQNKLKTSSTFVNNEREIDEYFTPIHRNFLLPEFPFEWLRLRNKKSSVILTYKHYHPEDSEIKTHCDEFETEIKNIEQFQKIIDALNFKKLVTVDKSREVYRLNEFEFALDRVEELGNFIEIEALKDFGGIEATRAKLFEIAKSFGITVTNFDKRGYPYLLMKKKGLVM